MVSEVTWRVVDFVVRCLVGFFFLRDEPVIGIDRVVGRRNLVVGCMDWHARKISSHVPIVKLLGYFNVSSVVSDNGGLSNDGCNVSNGSDGRNLDVLNSGVISGAISAINWCSVSLSSVGLCSVGREWRNLGLHHVVGIILRVSTCLSGKDCGDNESKSVH